MPQDPLDIPKADYDRIIQRISVADSPVGIDAQYTHAIIITYLREILQRIEGIESRLADRS